MTPTPLKEWQLKSYRGVSVQPHDYLQKQETIQYMHQGYAQTLFTNNYNFDFNIVPLHNYCYQS